MSLKVLQLTGRTPYRTALELQNKLFAKVKHCQDTGDAHGPNYLVLVEHTPVYTVGIRGADYKDKEMHARLRRLGADFEATNRGGLITFHGPGQLVAYPILNMSHFAPIERSIKRFVCLLESIIIDTCGEFGIAANRLPGYPGVWVDGERKIAALGIHASRFVTMHGLAINCNVELDWFKHIVPCGIHNKGVTSITNELGRVVKLDTVAPTLLNQFTRHLECSLDPINVCDI